MKKLVVFACRECPFMRDLPLFGGLTRALGGEPKGGYCCYERSKNLIDEVHLGLIRNGLPPGPERDAEIAKRDTRLWIDDRDKIPEKCPLRIEPVTVSLGS